MNFTITIVVMKIIQPARVGLLLYSRKGEDFLTETAVTPDRKVEKSFPRSEINCHGEG